MTKAISLWQPWASLWCSPAKVHETRHWPTSVSGIILVHAAKRKLDDFGGDPLGDICAKYFGEQWRSTMPRGVLIGAVRLVGCLPTAKMPIGHSSTEDYECGDFAPDRFAWRRADFQTFAEPIPYRGSQGFFEVLDDLVSGQLALRNSAPELDL